MELSDSFAASDQINCQKTPFKMTAIFNKCENRHEQRKKRDWIDIWLHFTEKNKYRQLLKSPLCDWLTASPAQGVICLRPKSAGIGSSSPATLKRTSDIENDGWTSPFLSPVTAAHSGLIAVAQ